MPRSDTLLGGRPATPVTSYRLLPASVRRSPGTATTAGSSDGLRGTAGRNEERFRPRPPQARIAAPSYEMIVRRPDCVP